VVKELTLIGSRCGPTDAALRLLARGLVDVEPLIGGIYRLADGAAAFNPSGGLKAIFDCRQP
jgi:threonine dehydrogenase-like Zn-dependent dehydrogenase